MVVVVVVVVVVGAVVDVVVRPPSPSPLTAAFRLKSTACSRRADVTGVALV